MVWILHKEQECNEKLKYKKLEITQPRIKNNFQLVNKPSWISPHKVLQLQYTSDSRDWLIRSIIYQWI